MKKEKRAKQKTYHHRFCIDDKNMRRNKVIFNSTIQCGQHGQSLSMKLY